MKRRTFLQSALGAAAVAPVLLDSVYARPSSPLPLLAQLDTVTNDKILILVQLFGGNDGLNTVIPVNDDNYFKIRPTIGIKKDALLYAGSLYMNPGLGGTNNLGGFVNMLNMGTLAVVQNIGYTPANLSHFRSTDIWLSGINSSDSNVRLDTGWLGRFLEQRYPNFPNQLPPDPLAINFGGFSLALTSEKGRMGIEVNNPSLQASGLSAGSDTLDANAPGTHYALEYAFVQDVAARSNTYAQRVKEAYNAGKPKLKAAYGADSLAQQMAAVAALIAGGLDTRVYVVSMGGFDTHVNQVDGSNPATGMHSVLLTYLANAITAFQADLQQLDGTGMKVSDRVLGFTMSEFGRRPGENGSFGTDHGAASVQFVFGTQVNSVVLGQTPDLANLDSNADLMKEFDYQQLYLALLTDWFGMTDTEARTVLQYPNTLNAPLPIIKPTANGVASRPPESLGLSIYPNPMTARSTVSMELPQAAYVKLELASLDGKECRTLMERNFSAGSYSIPFTAELPSGSYVLSLQTPRERLNRLVQVLR